jgi:type IV pilus assembly protein PilO
MQIGGVEVESLQFENVGSWPKSLRVIIFIVVFIVALVIGYFFDLSDLSDTFNASRDDRLKLQANYARIYHQAINLDAYRKQVEEVKAQLELITQQLPTSSEEALLLDELSSQASSSGLQFRSIKPLGEQRKGFYVEEPFEISMLGNFNSFGEFVSNLSSLRRIVTLHDFSIKDLSKGQGNLDITVVAKTYWISEEGRLGTQRRTGGR